MSRAQQTITTRDLLRWYKKEPREEYPEDIERPRTRGDCEGGERPCPWVSCRHHLYLDVKDTGAIQFNAESFEEMSQTCALDVADEGPHTLEHVGGLLGVTRERARQIEEFIVPTLRLRVRAQHAELLEPNAAHKVVVWKTPTGGEEIDT